MDLQHIAVALIVPACALYAAWALLGKAGRQRLAAWAARLPLPAPWLRRFGDAAAAANACGCDGCDRAAVSVRQRGFVAAGLQAGDPSPSDRADAEGAQDAVAVITLHRAKR